MSRDKERPSFSIDKSALDEEWLDQPERFYDFATSLADARQALDEAEAELDVTKAELDNRIRNDPEKYDCKATEAAIKACILTRPAYKKAQQAVIKAKHDVAIFQAGVTAMEHRKRALENLVDLHGQNYFAAPRDKSPDADEHRRRRELKSMKKSRRQRDDE